MNKLTGWIFVFHFVSSFTDNSQCNAFKWRNSHCPSSSILPRLLFPLSMAQSQTFIKIPVHKVHTQNKKRILKMLPINYANVKCYSLGVTVRHVHILDIMIRHFMQLSKYIQILYPLVFSLTQHWQISLLHYLVLFYMLPHSVQPVGNLL